MRSQFAAPLFAIVLIAACSPAVQPTPPPTPQMVKVAYPSSLRPFIQILPACLPDPPDYHLLLEELPADRLAASGDTITFWLGDQPPEGRYYAPLAHETIWVVLNAENPIKRLEPEEVQGLFGGSVQNWRQLDGPDVPVTVWIYPPGDELQALFENAFELEGNITSLAALVASPQAMLEAVALEVGAIGLLPGAWLTEGVTPVRSLGRDNASTVPLIAVTDSEPSGAARELIACLQGPAGQVAISARYRPWNETH